MPVMDGMAATRAIRATPGLASLPVVALTAGAFSSERAAATAAGMDEFVAKPFEVDVLVGVIQRLTVGAASRSDAVDGAVPVAATSPALTVPVFDRQAGIRLWGDEAGYQHFLRKFAEDHAHAAVVWQALDQEGRIAWVHKLKGTAGNLQLKLLAARAAEVEGGLHGAGVDDDGLLELWSALATTLAAIESYLAPTVGTGWAPTELAATENWPEGPDAAAALLGQVVAAIRLCSPTDVEPMLADLERAFGAERLARVQAALAAFDFDQAEVAVRQIGAEFGLALPSDQT